jgi:signal transduction histidine kinase
MSSPQESAAPDRFCAAIAAAAGALTFVESPKPAWAVACVLLALVPWALVVLRREPPAWLFVGLGVLPVVPVVLTSNVGVVIFMTTAVASRFAGVTDDWRVVAAVTAGIVVIPFLGAVPEPHDLYGAGYFAFGDLFGVLVGVLLRRSIRLAAQLREADARLATARVREDRQRIARDVHDLVAHSLTVVVLHVGGARRVLRADPAAAEAALADAERVCRESLDGIRGVVGLLRDDDARPGVSLDLAELAATYRAAGVDVRLEVAGDPATLPLATRVALYRVLQESLANAARYGAAGRTVGATVSVGPEEAVVAVENARDAAASHTSGGFGLAGLREQVAAADGELSSGPDGDRWRVACRLPVRQPAVAS